ALAAVSFVGVLAALAGRQLVEQRRDERRFPRRGARIAVGKEQPNLIVEGAGDGTVVFLAGLGNSALALTRVASLVAREAVTVLYDRAGLGWSGPLRGALDAVASADTLAAAMRQTDLSLPVVLVGHSYGGVVARVFAHRHPDLTAGLVMIDSAHEDQL